MEDVRLVASWRWVLVGGLGGLGARGWGPAAACMSGVGCGGEGIRGHACRVTRCWFEIAERLKVHVCGWARAVAAATSASSLPMMPMWDFTFWRDVVRPRVALCKRRDLIARRRGAWGDSLSLCGR